MEATEPPSARRFYTMMAAVAKSCKVSATNVPLLRAYFPFLVLNDVAASDTPLHPSNTYVLNFTRLTK